MDWVYIPLLLEVNDFLGGGHWSGGGCWKGKMGRYGDDDGGGWWLMMMMMMMMMMSVDFGCWLGLLCKSIVQNLYFDGKAVLKDLHGD